MYTLYKKVNDTESILAYCDDPMECAQAIRVDAEICDDDAVYRWEEDNAESRIQEASEGVL